MQFEMLAARYNWTIDRRREEIIFCLKDEALSFVSQLSPEVRSEWLYLIDAMNRRFGDHTLPETHRRELQQMKRAAGESFQEYSTRIEAKMSKAYPGMQNTQLYSSLSIEHMLNGIQNQSIAYDVMTRRPQTLQEAVSLLSWHSSCKDGIKAKQHVRHVAVEEVVTPEIKRVSNQQYVKEDRLRQFGQELTETIQTTMRDIQQDLKTYVDRKLMNMTRQPFVCYGCGEEGHTRKTCPLSREKRGQCNPMKTYSHSESERNQKPLN